MLVEGGSRVVVAVVVAALCVFRVSARVRDERTSLALACEGTTKIH